MAEANASGDTPPAANNAGNPPAGAGDTPPTNQEENVTLSKKDHDELQKKAAQTSEAQSRADTLAAENARLTRGGKRKVPVPTEFETKEVAEVKRRVTTEVLTNAEYQKLTQQNPVLAKVLLANPLQVLDTEEFVDVQDAVDQVLDYLDDLVAKGSGGTPPANPPETPPQTPPAPAAVNPPPGSSPGKTPEEIENERLSKLSPMERISAKIAGKTQIKQ